MHMSPRTLSLEATKGQHVSEHRGGLLVQDPILAHVEGDLEDLGEPHEVHDGPELRKRGDSRFPRLHGTPRLDASV